MDPTILEKLNEIFLALNDQSCSDEDRKGYETFLNEFIQEPESIFVFIEFLSNEAYSEEASFFAFAGLEKTVKLYWNTFSDDEKQQVIEKLLPFLFLPKKVNLLLIKLFYSKIRDDSYIQLWSDIFTSCQNEISQKDVSIEKVKIILQNVSILSKLIRNIFRDRPVDSEYLVQFNEITAPFFDLELVNSDEGLSILLNSIQSISNLFGRSLTKISDEYVDSRICELFQFFLKLYEVFNSISDLNDQQLNFIQSCSAEIYSLMISLSCRATIMDINEDGEEYLSGLIESILNEWKPQMESQIFDLCLSIFNQNPEKHFIISKIIRPLTIDGFSIDSISKYFNQGLQFISIPNDEKPDFFNYPDIYFQSQYCTVRDEHGDLRNNTILIYQNTFEKMSSEQIAFLFQNVLQNSEAEVFLIAKNAKTIISKGCSKILFHYIKAIIYYYKENQSDIFLIPTILYLFSKSINAITFKFVHQLIQYALNILEKVEVYPKVYSIIIVCVYFLYKVKKTINLKLSEVEDENDEVKWFDDESDGIPAGDLKESFPDEIVLNLLYKLINHYISSDVFKLIEMIAQDHQEIYPQLTIIYEPILKGIMDEIENYDSLDSMMHEKSQVNLTQMFSLLISIIEHNTDSGIEEELFNVLSACLKMSRKFDIMDEVLNVITVLIQLKSEASIHYLKLILSFISNNEEENEETFDNSMFRKSVLNFSIPFIVFMSNYPSDFIENDLLIETYKVLISLMNEEVINDAYDDFGLILLLTWIFQLQPQMVNNDQTGQNEDGFLALNTSYFFEYLNSRKDRDEEIMESATMNLALTFVLLEKIDLSLEFVEKWLNYIRNHIFIRIVDVQFHSLALQFFINQKTFAQMSSDNNLENSAIEIVELLQENPDDFLRDVIKSVDNEIRLSNFDYPIFSLFNKDLNSDN